MYLPQQLAAAVELCSLRVLQRTLFKGPGDVCLLQPMVLYMSIEDSNALGVGQEGLATPTVQGMDHLLVAHSLSSLHIYLITPYFY